MARFTLEEEERIATVAREEIQKRHQEAERIGAFSIVWRRHPYFAAGVWLTRDIDEELYEQYTYHLVFQVVFKHGGRYLRTVDVHEGGSNTWVGPFRCGSCISEVKKAGGSL
jgi:hypothetical protein